MSTAVILAGGQSRRMQRDKMYLTLSGQTFLASAVDRFSEYFDTVYLSLADRDKYPDVRAERVADIYPGCGPISGLHAGLRKTADDGVFLVAADLPFSDPRAAGRVIELTGGHDIGVMRDESGRYEPLFAYYKKSVLPAVEEALGAHRHRIADLFGKADVKIVTRDELGSLWNGRMLLNVNYPEDYEKLIREFSP